MTALASTTAPAHTAPAPASADVDSAAVDTVRRTLAALADQLREHVDAAPGPAHASCRFTLAAVEAACEHIDRASTV